VLDVHLLGSLFVTRAAWEHLGAHGAGRVVCTSSSIGLLGSPGQAAYAMAKTALVGLTRALAAEGAPLGIAANAVAPMATTRLNRDVMVELFGAGADELTPDRVAPAVAYLCHPGCQLNGEVLSVAGGRMARFALGEGPATTGPLPPEAVNGRLAQLLATAPTRWWPGPPSA